MAFLRWISGNGLDLLQTASILVGLFATVHTVRAGTRERKIQNLLALNAAHRELWLKFLERPDVQRIYKTDVDLSEAPPTPAEKRFVQLLILHLRAAFKAREAGMEFADDEITADIQQFFARPIPRAVWDMAKQFQDAAFVAFVEENLEADTFK